MQTLVLSMVENERVFVNAHILVALDALQMVYPMFTVSPMSDACIASKKKVKSSSGNVFVLRMIF